MNTTRGLGGFKLIREFYRNDVQRNGKLIPLVGDWTF